MSAAPLLGSRGPRNYGSVPGGWEQENGNTWARIDNTQTIILFLKGMVGTGILAMPDAFKKGGLVLGPIGKGALGTLLII